MTALLRPSSTNIHGIQEINTNKETWRSFAKKVESQLSDIEGFIEKIGSSDVPNPPLLEALGKYYK